MEKSKPRRRRLFYCVLFCALFGLVVLIAGVALWSRGPAVPRRCILVLRIGSSLPAKAPGLVETVLFGPGGPPIPALYGSLSRAAADDCVRGVLLDLQSGSLNLADAQELRLLIASLRQRGKKVVAFGDDLSLNDWFVATACDEICINPTGYVRLTGIGLRVLLLGGLLEKYGLKADLLRIGRYKTAWESLTGTELSGDSREALTRIVDASWKELLEKAGAARGIEPAALEKTINAGPLTAAAALEQKLVDRVCWRNDLESHVTQAIDAEACLFSWELYAQAIAGGDAESRIAYLPLTGTIVPGHQGGGSVLAADWAVKQLAVLRDEESIDAVILRVDSPGGDALASARLYHAVTETCKKKPVVVSMGSTAASGGYYIAAAADHVVAHPFTVTGSIGIFGGKIVASKLAAEYRVTQECFYRGDFAGMFDPFESFNDKVKEGLARELAQLYETFLRDVAAGRDREVEDIRHVAEGRVWTGRDALDRGLVDAIGGLAVAVAKARELARIKGAADLVLWPPAKPWYRELLSPEEDRGGVWGRSDGGAVQRLVPGGLAAGVAAAGETLGVRVLEAGNLTAMAQRLCAGRPLALLPFALVWE